MEEIWESIIAFCIGRVLIWTKEVTSDKRRISSNNGEMEPFLLGISVRK